MSESKECYIPRRWWDALKKVAEDHLTKGCSARDLILDTMKEIEKGSTTPKPVYPEDSQNDDPKNSK